MILDVLCDVGSIALDVVETATGINTDDIKTGWHRKHKSVNRSHSGTFSIREERLKSLKFWKEDLEWCKKHNVETRSIEAAIKRITRSLDED